MLNSTPNFNVAMHSHLPVKDDQWMQCLTIWKGVLNKMDAYEIIITPDAEADLFEIRDYIAYTLSVPDVALNYIRAIRSEIQKLTYMASSIVPVKQEPWHSRGVRKIIAKNFLYLLSTR